MHYDHLPVWAQILLADKRAVKRPAAKSHAKETLPDPRDTSNEFLVLIAHGSRDPRWRGTFECLYASVTARYGNKIKLAFMEFVGPTLMDIARECYEAGAGKITVLPLFMAGGAHVATDIPEQADQVRAAYPGMRVVIERPIGEDPRVFAVLQEIIGEHAHSSESSLGVA